MELNEQTEYGLDGLAEYWQALGGPDSISPGPPGIALSVTEGEPQSMNAVEKEKSNWRAILSGRAQRPRLNISKSETRTSCIERTWDVDSIIFWASCLSINRGLYVSYHLPVSRNLRSSVHVFHPKKPLHTIPHIRLGSGRQSPQFGVYVFFPGISRANRETTYLTDDERRTWIYRLFLRAIRSVCPPDIVQYHPRSFDDVESKTYSRQRETCDGKVRSSMDMHHSLSQKYLQAIWHHMVCNTHNSELAMSRGMFLVLSAKNIKLEAKLSTFQACRANIISHLQQFMDWSQADLTNTWMDIGVEDTADQNCTLLFKSHCLRSWIRSMTRITQSPLVASEHINWNLTEQSGSARVETRKVHPLRRGGIAYAQRYNVSKDLFSTAAKQDFGLFGEPHPKGLTCPPSLLDAWIVAAWQSRASGIATSRQSTPQLKRLRQVFEARKSRLRHALDSSVSTSSGVREEYRISWKLFMNLSPLTSSPRGCHRPFLTLPTAQVNSFMRQENNRWLAAIDFVRVQARDREACWEDHQRNMIMVTILLRSLKASVNCHQVARRSQMFKGTYQNRKGQPLRGLDFEGSMRQSGLASLTFDMFHWEDFHLRDEIVASTTFTFNGLQGIFRNWKGVKMISREYCKASELEEQLRTGEGDRSETMDMPSSPTGITRRLSAI